MAPDITSITATAPDGLHLPVDHRGTGTPVLFINGLTQTRLHWRTQLRLFSDLGYSTAAFDGRGQGDVPAHGIPTRADHARDLCAVQDALGWSACHVVGFSHGARVAAMHARMFPHRVTKLVLVGASGGLHARARLVVEGWLRVLTQLGPQELAVQSLPWILGDDYLQAHANQIQMMVRTAVHRNRAQGTQALLNGLLQDPGSMEEMAEIRAPTLLLAGAEDRFAPPSVQKRLLSHLPHARVHQVEGSGHTIAIEQPEAFAQAIHAFLSGGSD